MRGRAFVQGMQLQGGTELHCGDYPGCGGAGGEDGEGGTHRKVGNFGGNIVRFAMEDAGEISADEPWKWGYLEFWQMRMG